MLTMSSLIKVITMNMVMMNNLTLLDLSSHDDGLWQGRRPQSASWRYTLHNDEEGHHHHLCSHHIHPDGGDENGLAKILRITDPECDHLQWSQLLHRITGRFTALYPVQCIAAVVLLGAKLYCSALLHCSAIVCIAMCISEVEGVSSNCAALHWFTHYCGVLH